MKNLFGIITGMMILCMATVSAYASEPYEQYQKGLFALDLGLGDNIDLSSLSQEQETVFEKRPESVFQIMIRPNYYFSCHWGAYVDMRFNFFRFDDKERLLDLLLPGLSKLKPSLSLGGTCRCEIGPWQIHPRLGVGIVGYGGSSIKLKLNGNETMRKRTGGMWSVDAGLLTAYRFSKLCSIFLDFNIMQPFIPAKYIKTTTIDGVTTRYEVDSYTWGRSMTISLGVRLQAPTNKGK